MTNYIWITTQKEMIHKYPAAPDDVAFLRNEHRHIFHFKIYCQVESDDREIEFIRFKRWIEQYINELDKDLDIKSCEMISNCIAEHIQLNYPNRKIIIEVSEDGENGSFYEYEANHKF